MSRDGGNVFLLKIVTGSLSAITPVPSNSVTHFQTLYTYDAKTPTSRRRSASLRHFENDPIMLRETSDNALVAATPLITRLRSAADNVATAALGPAAVLCSTRGGCGCTCRDLYEDRHTPTVPNVRQVYTVHVGNVCRTRCK